jgi:peptide subunit release factor 1 (eRF1)
MGLPLVLAALPEHHHLFHKVNKNPLLQKDGIMVGTKSMHSEKMAEMAWEIIQQNYLLRLKELTEKFEQAKGNSNTSDSLEKIAKAMAAGRVETLLLEQNRIIPGKIIDADSGTIEIGDLKNPEVGDLLDAIAQMATEKGTEVIVIPRENMPAQSGLAAIFRY